MQRLVLIAMLSMAAIATAQAQPADQAPQPETSEAEGATAQPDAEPAAPTDSVDITELRKEYLRLRDLLFRSRARAAAVGDALYSTQVTVNLHFPTGRFYDVSRATIRLDGANVFDDVQGTIAKDKAPRFEGFIAPGRHRIGVRVETTGRDDDRFDSTLETTFSIQAPAGHDVTVDIVAADEGDIPYKWGKKQRGTYDLRLKASVTAKERPGATASTK